MAEDHTNEVNTSDAVSEAIADLSTDVVEEPSTDTPPDTAPDTPPDTAPDTPPDTPPDEEDGEEIEPIRDAVEELAETGPDLENDDPEAASQDEQWLGRLKPATKRRFERLLKERSEAYSKAEDLQKQAEENQGVLEMFQELRQANLSSEEIENGHAIMYALKNEPQQGIKSVWDYMQAYAKNANIDIADVIPEFKQQQTAVSETNEAEIEDLDLLVEEGLLSEAQRDILLKNSNNSTKNTTQPPSPSQIQPQPNRTNSEQTGPTATELVAGYLAEQGVAAEKMYDVFNSTLAPEMLRLVAEDNLAPETLTPRQQLRYAQLAWAAKKPAPAKQVAKQKHPVPDAPGEAARTRNTGEKLSPVQAAIAELLEE